MSLKLLTFFSLVPFMAQALEMEHSAYVRNDFGFLREDKVTLTQLKSSSHFIGEHFIILEGKSETPVAMDGTERAKRAATAYMNLMRAKDYFNDHIQSELVQKMDQIKVRLDITNEFSDVGHFAHDEFAVRYNDALTLVPSKENKLYEGVEPWGYEIWYRPPFEKERVNSLTSALEIFDSSPMQNQMGLGIFENQLISAAQQTSINGFSSFDSEFHLQSMAISLGFTFLLPKTLKLASKQFKTSYYLDTAGVPEVSIHEFSHVALSDFMPPRRKTPVIEGMANFFTGKITGQAHFGNMNGKRSKNIAGKNAGATIWYETKYELEKLSTADLVFKILWEVDKTLGPKGEMIIFNARKFLDSSSNIKDSMTQALFLSIDDLYPQKNNNLLKLKLQEVFQMVGL